MFLVLSDGKPGQCQSSISVGQKISIVTLTSGGWSTVISTITSASFINGIQVNGWNFATQTSSSSTSSSAASLNFSPTPSPSSSATSSTSSIITTSSSSNSAQASNNNQRTIGISVGVSVGAVAVIIAILVGWYFGRRRSRSYYPAKDLTGAGESQLWYGPGNTVTPSQVQEVQGSIAAYELEQPPIISELHSDQPFHRGAVRGSR